MKWSQNDRGEWVQKHTKTDWIILAAFSAMLLGFALVAYALALWSFY